jgi:hypothetical protein
MGMDDAIYFRESIVDSQVHDTLTRQHFFSCQDIVLAVQDHNLFQTQIPLVLATSVTRSDINAAFDAMADVSPLC